MISLTLCSQEDTIWVYQLHGPGYRVHYKHVGKHIIVGRRLGKKSGGSGMSRVKTTPYDVADHLRAPEEMAAYLEACIEEADGDAAFIAKALGDIARAKGMSYVAREAGLSRESLYKALSGQRSPSFETILKVLKALDLELRVEAKTSHAA